MTTEIKWWMTLAVMSFAVMVSNTAAVVLLAWVWFTAVRTEGGET